MNTNCAECTKKPCRYGEDLAAAPTNCPSRATTVDETLALYSEEEKRTSCIAAAIESSGYGKLTRVEEIMEYAHRCGYNHLGLAFCVGFSGEAAALSKILRENGFTVSSVCCKNGEVPKDAIGVTRENWLNPNATVEIMCNPAGQAEVLNSSDAEFVLILGLCVGHDTIFISHLKKPCTYVAVKDRALGHNPIAALYCCDSYLRRLHTYSKKWETE